MAKEKETFLDVYDYSFIDGDWYKDDDERIFYCEDCGERKLIGQSNETQIEHPDKIICGDCFERGDYTKCEKCHNLQGDNEIYGRDGRYYCEDCDPDDDEEEEEEVKPEINFKMIAETIKSMGIKLSTYNEIMNTKAADEREKAVHIVDVIRHGESIMIPESMSLREVREVLERREKEDEKEVRVRESYDAFVWDGAHALSLAMDKKFGWFGELMQIEIDDKGTTTDVPWGRFCLPGIEGYIETGYDMQDGRIIFQASATVKKKNERQMKELFALTREILKEKSIYKGKALRLEFFNKDGDPIALPKPKFINLDSANEGNLIYSDEVASSIRINLFTPIEKMATCKKFGIPTKRGILLAGNYGTGKTLAAYVAAKKATDNGITFIYCSSADEFEETCRFAQQYSPAVVFCEDIDKVTSDERDIKMDGILNIIDGIDSKESDIITVLTTNSVKEINQAMLRPGRLDAIIHVTEPDAKAVEALIRHYGKGLIDHEEDLAEIGEFLNGNIPAVIRECVERAKLVVISQAKANIKNIVIKEPDLLSSAKTMKMQLDLLLPQKNEELSAMEQFGRGFGKEMQKSLEAFSKIRVNHNGIAVGGEVRE